VEDHPVEYAEFEGVIPDGNYGAGPSIAWDRGLWVPHEDPDEGLVAGKLSFELRGYKLRGVFHLFRPTGKGRPAEGKEWLLVKKPDAWAKKGESTFSEASIYSGLTVEELAEGPRTAERARVELVRLGAPRGAPAPDQVKLMLAETAEGPFSSPDWVFELKHDGFRLLAGRQEGSPQLIYRRGSDSTAVFPEVARALRALPFGDLVLDGEVVVLDETGRPRFQSLQKRVQLARAPDIERASWSLPATYFAFDLLAFEDYDLRPLPLLERKRLLKDLLPAAGPLRYADHVAEAGEAFFEEVRRLGLEGIMAKRAASPYLGQRSGHWLKVRVEKTADLVVVGFTPPAGSRTGFGALHLAGWAGDALVYAGRAGSGFTEKQLGEVRGRLEGRRRSEPPCGGPTPKGREHGWVEPELVAEVRYLEWTEEGLLRQPVFLRFRDDKAPEECRLDLLQAGARPPDPPEIRVPEAPRPRKLSFTNLDKVFWPEEGYTKGDLIEFYRGISPWVLPYLLDRPLVLTRYPDGIHGRSFYQKDAPDFAPDWIRTVRVYSGSSERDIDYFVCDDEETLLYLANLGTIPLHVWSSRVADIQHPDWCILDLDPKGAPFEHVVAIALALRELCRELDLPAYVKTSGSTGLHVLVPLGAQCTYEQSRSLGQLMAWVITRERGDIATIARALRDRQGKVYLDFLQNVHGQLLVSPFCVRPLPGAPVSTPLLWDEVAEGLDPRRFTIRTVRARMESLGGDPLRGVLTDKPDLLSALARLQDRLGAASRTAP
jgi:bifunctional non-homologous end joining protein LigD